MPFFPALVPILASSSSQAISTTSFVVASSFVCAKAAGACYTLRGLMLSPCFEVYARNRHASLVLDQCLEALSGERAQELKEERDAATQLLKCRFSGSKSNWGSISMENWRDFQAFSSHICGQLSGDVSLARRRQHLSVFADALICTSLKDFSDGCFVDLTRAQGSNS